MNVSSLRCTTSLLALSLLTCAARTQVTIVDELFPGAVAGDQGPAVTRLVDDLTGAPIAGAEVFLVDESKTPIAGEFWFSHRGVSDADGFVRIPRPNGDKGWYWQVMKHPQLGVAERGSYIEPIWRIGRTFDVPLEVRDWIGRPAAGALVGFCGGCGHSPDIATAVAGANGLAVLRGVDPQQGIKDLYVQQPGLHFFYDSIRWRPGEPPMVVDCAFGPAQTGRVVDHTGAPVAGAFVCGGSKHRGPWARTAADGSFTILGGERGDRPHQVVLPGGREIYFDVQGDDPYPVTLHLPDLTNANVHQGPAESAPAGPKPPTKTRPMQVTVQGAPTAAELEFHVAYPGEPQDSDAAAGPVDVPESGPFLLTVWSREGKESVDREFAFADGASIADPLVVQWAPAARAVGHAVDAAGAPIKVRARWREYWSEGDERGDWSKPTSDIDLASEDRGWRLLELQADGGATAERLLWVMVPGPGGRVDLGSVQVGGAPRLRVLEADGAPLATAAVAMVRPGWREVGQAIRWSLTDDGAWRGPDLRAGDGIVVQRTPDSVPFRTVLQGDGPWQITPPDGALELEVVDASGAPLACTVVIGDHCEEAEQGKVALRGLPLGSMRCYVSAPGHRSAIVDANVARDAQSVRVALPTR